MNKNLLKDIIDWDIENWSKAIYFWEKHLDIKDKSFECLELGSRKGGLSLWLAVNGNTVICSDIVSPQPHAEVVHQKYDCQKLITYQAVDAANMDFQNQFDVVAFKSVLGGISRNENDNLKQNTIHQIYKALKPNGALLFAENMESTFLHKILRKKFAKWGNWNYLKVEEINSLFSEFKSVQYITVGFFGTFGRTEKQRQILGKFDSLIEKMIPQSKRYILIGIAQK